MRIKHWQGYGTLNAVRTNTTTNGDNKIMTIMVSGNHEYGLACTDKYNIFNWLLRKFDKTASDYRCIEHVKITSDYDHDHKCDTCCYVIEYKAS